MDVTEETIRAACETTMASLRHNCASLDELHSTRPPADLINLYRELCREAGPVYRSSISAQGVRFLESDPIPQNASAPGAQLTFRLAEETVKLNRKIAHIINERDHEIERLKREQDNKISRIEKEKGAEVAMARAELAEAQLKLGNILASRSWRFMRGFQAIRLFLFPRGSQRESIAARLFHTITLRTLREKVGRTRRGKTAQDHPVSKVICIHHRLAGMTSPHFNESTGFKQQFARRGKEFLLFISIHASAEIATALDARPVLDDPTFRMEWSFDERTQRFSEMLHAQIDPCLNAGDWVMVTIATQLEAHALTRWLQELPGDKKPWIIVLFLSDRWNRSDKKEYDRQAAEFDILRKTLSGLSSEDANRMIFCAITDLLSMELKELLGTDVAVSPIPLEYGDPAIHTTLRPEERLPRVAVLGGTRREKGSHLLPDIIRACQSQVEVEFLIHLANNTLTNDEVERLASIRDQPHVRVLREPLSLPQYNVALNSADIVLFPYEVIPYRKRISGVFAEAVAYGKPVVATGGTWMSQQIQTGRAAGVVFDELEPASIARAVRSCVKDLCELQAQAQALSGAWRKQTGMDAFLDFVERQVSLRARRQDDAVTNSDPTMNATDLT
jgi:hypothetical protein